MSDARQAETLRVEDETEAAGVLARAFRDNPGMFALFDTDDDAKRLRLLSLLTPTLVAGYRKHGAALVARNETGAIAGVALTLGPGQYPPSFAMQTQLTLGVIAKLPVGAAVRVGIADIILKKHHTHGSHEYLFMLGVEPEAQGRGHGSVLLRELARRADAAGQPCYLETDKASSVRLYERHGYVVTHTDKLPRVRNLELWFMQRPAQRES